MIVRGINQVIQAFDRYQRNWQRKADEIPYEIKTSIIRQIIRTGSIDTTRFIRAVDFREDAVQFDQIRYLIDAMSSNPDVTYDGFLETGTKRPNAYGVTFAPRLNYGDGIENANLEQVFDNFADSAFGY